MCLVQSLGPVAQVGHGVDIHVRLLADQSDGLTEHVEFECRVALQVARMQMYFAGAGLVAVFPPFRSV